MKHFLLSLFFPFLIVGGVFINTGSLFAQESKSGVLNPDEGGGWLIGPLGGINLVSYKTDVFAILNSEPSCFTAQNGSDVAPFFGLSAEIPLGETMQSFIIIEGVYDSKSSKFTTANNTRSNIPSKLNGVVVNGSITTSETATLNYLLVNGGYKYNFTTGPAPVGPGVQGLISLGLPLSPKLNKTVSVSASSGVASSPVSQNTQTSAVAVSTAGTGTTASFRIALRGQFTYDIPLTGNGSWTVTPTVGYDFPFTKVDNGGENWTASSAFGGIYLRYFIGK